MKDCLFSIIVPVYNVEPYLSVCLDSVLAQTERDWECILIDDGSTDRSGEICEEYARRDPRFRVIHQPNGGLSAARNTGLDNMRGRFVTFVDSDDAIGSSYLTTLYDLIEVEDESVAPLPGVDISVLGYVRFSEDILPEQTESEESFKTWRPEEGVEEMLYQNGFLYTSAWGKMFRAELFEGLRFTPGILYEDLDLMYRLFLRSKGIIAKKDQKYFYRQNPGSLTSVPSPRRMDAVTVCEGIVRYMKENHPSLLPAAEDRLLSAGFNMLGLMAAYPGILDAHKKRCQHHVATLSSRSLRNKKVRRKNKLGILLYSFPFRPLFSLLARRLYR